MNASTELRNLNAVTLHKRNSLEAKCNVRKADELATPRFVLLGWDSSGSYRDRWRALENTVRRLKKITSVDCYLSLIMAEIIIKLNDIVSRTPSHTDCVRHQGAVPKNCPCLCTCSHLPLQPTQAVLP
ncbi:uncharacterized protein LOC110827061 isoform X1 [Zootermopsis nevadensis]|uniref:uncharacterized protein LOC110827061 isoform X1 n=1 Tax=Zootermopsis nevadensis TaxID=136037 RepID=UPI000B8EB53B|nr:uncharacterized protein LOC110827061 isoform X1 [Zootermopsis nevadensis]